MKFLAIIFFILSCPMVFGADATPRSNVAVCGDNELLCSDVIQVGVRKRHAVDAFISGGNLNGSGSIIQTQDVYSAAGEPNAASSASDNPILLVKNPSGSGKILYILNITANSTISNERTLFKIFHNPTITLDGSALTPALRNLGISGSPQADVFALPTVSANGALVASIQSGENTNSQDLTHGLWLAIQPNNNMMITARPKSNNRAQAITVLWYEDDI